jgi:hypothetical protein
MGFQGKGASVLGFRFFDDSVLNLVTAEENDQRTPSLEEFGYGPSNLFS